MMFNRSRRGFLTQGIRWAGVMGVGHVSLASQSLAASRPLIYIVTFRGATEVEKGFISYLNETALKPRFVTRDIGRDQSLLPGLVQEIKAARADLVLAWGTSVTEGLVGKVSVSDTQRFLSDIPVVYALVAAPIEAGLVLKLQSSDRNLTGVYHVASLEQQWDALNSYRPVRSIGMVYTPTEQNAVVTVRAMQQLGQSRGVRVLAVPAELDAQGKPIAQSLIKGVQTLAQQSVQWLYLPPDSFVGANARQLVIPAAHRLGLPTFASTEQLMDAGALVGLISHYYDIGAFAGYKAWQILEKHKAPRDIPSQTLSQFTLRINPAVAQSMNLAPPLGLFAYATFK